MKNKLVLALLFFALVSHVLAERKSPPGWIPLSILDDKPTWSEVREIKDRIHRPQGVTIARRAMKGLKVLSHRQVREYLAAFRDKAYACPR